MKNFRHIFVLLLALVVFVLGAGTGVVHICSVYCKTQVCSSLSHSCTASDTESCCHYFSDKHESEDAELSEHCSCLNLSYNIDFFKLSQDDISFTYMPMVLDMLEIFAYNIINNTINSSYEKAMNAPPYNCDGRTLLAFHSILII